MKRTVVLSGVPAEKVDEVVADFTSEGANVTRKSAGKGLYTVTAEFPKTDSTDEAIALAVNGGAAPDLAPGEEERPSRSELEAAGADGPLLYYPAAKRDVLGQMKTVGRYVHGYPVGAIVHYTAGGQDPLSDVRHALNHGYCYFVIGPSGDVYQNFPLDRWGWHAGKSRWPGLGSGVSQHLVGIEICCAGKVDALGNGTFRPWFNREEERAKRGLRPDPRLDLPASEVRTVPTQANQVAGHYHKYSLLQEAALRTLLHWLHANNPAFFSFDRVLGHDEVSPGRKVDPGGSLSMTMPEFRQKLRADGDGA